MTGQPLHVESDLTFSVDGPSGLSTGTVRASGSRVTVRSSHPVSMMEAVLGADGGGARTPAAAVGDFLAGVGLTVDVIGPRGLVVTMGDGVESAIGALVSGTRRVRPGSLRAAGPLAVARIRRPQQVRGQATIGAVALVALVAADVARRRLARRASA